MAYRPLPDLSAPPLRHCAACDTYWVGGTECWCCGAERPGVLDEIDLPPGPLSDDFMALRRSGSPAPDLA